MIEQFQSAKIKDLTVVHSFRRIGRFEHDYKQTLLRVDKSFENTFETYLGLERIHQSLKRYIDLLRVKPSARSSSAIDQAFDAYLKNISSVHERCSFWIKIYLGLIWPEEIISKELRKSIKAFPKELWQTQAKESLENLNISHFIDPQRKDSLETIRRLYQNHKSIERFSRAWNDNHKKLVNAVFDELTFTAHMFGQRISNCFKKIVYTLSAGNGEQSVRQIYDWIDGYKPPGALELNAQQQANRDLFNGLRLCEINKNIKLTLRAVLIGSCIVLIYALLHANKIDVGIYTFLKEKTLQVLGLDPASLSLKAKKDYFNKFILEINEQLKPEDLAKELEIFKDQRMFQQPDGMFLFAENILGQYFLLLSAGKVPLALKSDTAEVAGLMDNNVKSVMERLTQMFDDKIIQDSKLRDLILELRRALVRHNVFPFTFIVIKGNRPYLFMYPEKILQRFRFTTQHLEHIGFNSSYYSQRVRFPLRVFVVKGDRYPFKDRAGYFEGEFAIVFADLAARVEWSAWHEFAHIIDHMRLTHGGKMLPRNIESNAMLFPALFSQDPKGYFEQRLFPIIAMRDPKDAYVQATKGILNGFLLLNAQKTGTPKTEITDQFLPEDILAAQKLISSLGNDSIRNIALEIFKKPDVYLKTAKPGNYRGVISNAEEIIAGTPRAPYGGFILGSGYPSSEDEKDGIQFIFDNQSNDFGFFQGKNIFGILQEIFLFMSQAHNSEAKGFTLINIIAGIIDFILILGSFLGIHWWGTPLRKRKFYGPEFSKWFDSVYKNNPLSDGRGTGDLPGEKLLLIQVLSSNGMISDELAGKIKALKSGMNPQRTAVFDTLLTLAFFNPGISLIRSKWHDFMFWFPYFGPHLARNPWLFPRQKAFRQWEAFNGRLLALAKSIQPQTQPETFRQQYLNILREYRRSHFANDPVLEKKLLQLSEIRKQSEKLLAEPQDLSHHTSPVMARQLPWVSLQDGEFSHLTNYTWNDDVKRIDWKATARSPSQEAKVRKYAGMTSAHFDFLFDFRQINLQTGRDRLARDLNLSLKVLKNDNELKAITLIMPWGETRQTILNLKSHTNLFEISNTIWSAVINQFEYAYAQKQALKAEELVFYTDEENSRYRAITRLREFDTKDDITQTPDHIPTKSVNVYLIGADEISRHEIMSKLPGTHQPFYWR